MVLEVADWRAELLTGFSRETRPGCSADGEPARPSPSEPAQASWACHCRLLTSVEEASMFSLAE